MQIRSASDVVYTTVAWLPILALVIATAVWLAGGVAHLEARTWGSEYIISNQGSVNQVELQSTGSDPQVAVDL